MKKFVVLALSLLLTLILVTGCIRFHTLPVAATPTVVTPLAGENETYIAALPTVINFEAEPKTITADQRSNLIWMVTGVDSVTIEPGLGIMSPAGSFEITPTATTVYTLTAGGADGMISRSVTVIVNPVTKSKNPETTPPDEITDNTSTLACPPIDVSFSVFPDQVAFGEQRTLLMWSVKGANRVRIEPDIGEVPAAGNWGIMPKATTTYFLTAESDCCVVTKSVTVTVIGSFTPPDGGPVVELFNVAPVSIYRGESAILQWRVKNAQSVSIDQSIGFVPSSGSIAVSPLTNTTYTLTVANGAAFYPVSVKLLVFER